MLGHSKEILAYDNGTKDGSAEYLATRFAEYPQVKMIDSGFKDGVCAGKNKSVSLTQAPILLFMDSNSLLPTSDTLNLVVSFLPGSPRPRC
jgi:GT2 family glycosyltransferase